MGIASIVKVATTEFETRMAELGKNLDTRQLTADLAEQVSQALQKAISAAGRAGYKAFLESYDSQEPVIKVNGQPLRRKRVSPKSFLTPFGTIQVLRSLYQADRGGESYVPLDQLWEMDGHFATVEVRQAVCLALAHMTAEETEQLFDKCSLFRPSATALKHIIEKVSREIEPRREQLEAMIHGRIEFPQDGRVLVASMDGVNVLLRERGVRRGRPSERPGHQVHEAKKTSYRNAMVGAFSFYGEVPEAQKCPQRLGRFYTARMPEDKAVTFKRQFEQSLDAVEQKIGPGVIKILLFDGHRSLWNYADTHERFDEYEKLIDFYHTQEHLSKAAEALFGKSSGQGQQWYAKYRTKLLEQDAAAEAILRSIDYYSGCQRLSRSRRKDLAAERTFFRRNKHRMTYASFRRRGLPIGSGPVEAACKSIVKTRLCRSGMRWSRQGGQRILDFRCYAKSGLWNEFWDTYKYVRRSA